MASAKSNPPPLSPTLSPHASILLPPAFASPKTAALTFLAPATSPSSGIFNERSPESVLFRPPVYPIPFSGVKNPTRTCACAPITHPGSFRCSLHKSEAATAKKNNKNVKSAKSVRVLDLRRLAMRNSMARSISEMAGGELVVKRILSAMISPSSRCLRRRDNFQPRPSRLSIMSKADD